MNQNYKQTAILYLSCTLLGAVLVALVVLRDSRSLTWHSALTLCVLGCLVYLASALIIFGISYYTINVLTKMDKSLFEEHCRLIALKLSACRRNRNSQIIAPRLRYFVFTVIKKNNEFLCLPIGDDELSLVIDGTVFRQNCCFYRFSLILPDDLEQDTETLRQLIQSYVEQELQSYGIYGLRSTYGDVKFGNWYTVYTDKIETDEKRHRLIFEVLYINNSHAVFYRKMAADRETIVQPQKQDVYDDEIR